MSDCRFEDGAVVVDAAAIGRSLGIDDALVQPLMREGKITSLCEHGTDEDAGTYRLTFFYGSRRARMIVTQDGSIVRHSRIDFGPGASAAMTRRPR